MDALDALYLDRACELAARGLGNTSPNPPVGAVIVRDGEIVGEGFHHRAGEAHAETIALRQAGERARGATLYVSLEPCNHYGRTPPCSHAVVAAGIVRVVAGTPDPNPNTTSGGTEYLRAHAVEVEIAGWPRAKALIEPFSIAIRLARPYVALKMAMSLDGFVASMPRRREWLTGNLAAAFVREMRIMHDGVIVGAGTVRTDDPLLTVRPPHHRLREYVRIVACEADSVPPSRSIFKPLPGYAKTIVLAPAGAAARFADLHDVADVVFIGDSQSELLDLQAALEELKRRGISTLLCEGGPTMAGHLLEARLVDRVYWLVAPRLLRSPFAVPVITAGTLTAAPGLSFDRVEVLEPDLLLSGTIEPNV
ncbi:MAG TPA: bifunctional diaminohydroxyphosphoribosylaminopyrimidine deaminase/5-amino-6-(5-phosphoribosylamino)uracil reductase RibD [Candidatus Baltobacteraceae bacterium]|nr:bifunctional diaminohydroxyphosphoribosylaminopyrimidine deaminase/5-amino-6-(5-phosphoribosylamino)uracil reductase RibD [Candidatus Baltobacteraceae bacterium]